ncbi:MAG: cell division protein SepF, partial [Wujia sp.]
LFDDDDEDDDDDYEPPVRSKKSGAAYSKTSASGNSSYASSNKATSYSNYNTQPKQQARQPQSSGKLVDFNNSRQQRQEGKVSNEVYVIKPQEISDSQTVTDFLKNGKTIVINMEGLELAPAQRIIDFIGGACYALNGTLQAISANIFIAAPSSIEVSGDLREEILNETTVSPQLGRY